jgi:hypothetical protein
MRLLVVGNCHAQYLGAALRTVPDLDVRVIGKSYIGPIHFQRTLPRMTTAHEAREWLQPDDLMLRQITAHPKWAKFKPPVAVETVNFPYFEVPEPFGLAPWFDPIEAFAKAGLDPEPVFARLGEPGAVMYYNKFSGAVFAELLAALTPRLAHRLPEPDLALLAERMRGDRGIAHDPHPSTVSKRNGPEMRQQAIWANQLREYKQTGSRKALINCLRVYRPRLYASWAIELCNALVNHRRTYLATVLLTSRIAFEDARGRLFAYALGLSWYIRESYDAFRALERAAAKWPDTRIPFLLEAVKQIG